jgi:steroid delta-isomerase-like uncharacterized protein
MSESAETLVRRWFDEVWNRGDASAIDRLLAPDAVVHGLSPDGKPIVGREGFKPFYEEFRTGFPDLHVTIDQVLNQGDRVAVYCLAEGTHTGPMMGKAPTHLRVSFTGMVIVRTDGQFLVEGWNAWDFLRCFTQIGFQLQ